MILGKNKNINLITQTLNNQKQFFNTNTTKDIQFRIQQLKILKNALQINENKILEALYKDLGKSQSEGFMTELAMVYAEINTTLKNIKKWSKPKRVKASLSTFPARNYIYYEPYGTVLIISPWNYPINLTFCPLVAAIASGNCAIIKCSRNSIHTANIINEIINATFESNYISCIDVLANYDEVLNQKYDYIFFTGSPRVGKEVMKVASNNLIPVTLELGGKSPCIIDKSANLKQAAKKIAWGKFLNAGQTCVSVDYILIHSSIKNTFIEELVLEIKNNYDFNSDDYPKIINQHHFERLSKLISTEKDIIGGNVNPITQKIEPTIFINSDFDKEIMKEEIFGPLLPIIEYDDLDDVINKIKTLEKPLACYVFTNDKLVETKVINSLSYGGGCVNDVVVHCSEHNLPFGGVGFSGMSYYHGKYGFYTLSHQKGIVKGRKFLDLPFRYKPFDDKKLKMFRKLFKG